MKKEKSTEKPLLPMIDVISAMTTADGTLKSRAHTFLRRDFSQLRSEADFREAFSGLAALDQLLSPQHRNYREAVAGMRKSLEIYHRVNKWLLPDAAVKEVERGWREMCELFKKHLAPETWEKAEELTVRVFKDVRKLLEDAKPR